ncbi:MAG: RidA family protein [Candidatus Zixiibacteriota bacterium]
MREYIQTKHAPAAIGPYSQGIKSEIGKIIFCSGQIPLDPESGKIIGQLTAEQAEQCLKNIQAILVAGGADLKDVIKVTIYIINMADFQSVNEIYAKYFTTFLPARAVVEVSRLPKDVKIMIDATAVI